MANRCPLVPFGALGVVQRDAGVVVQVAERARAATQRGGDADGDGRLEEIFRRAAGAAQKLQDQTGDALDRIEARDVLHQHDELIVVRARHQVGGTEHRGEHLRGVHDDRIARLAPVLGVDGVERVVVDDEERVGALLVGLRQEVVDEAFDGVERVQAGGGGEREGGHGYLPSLAGRAQWCGARG